MAQLAPGTKTFVGDHRGFALSVEHANPPEAQRVLASAAAAIRSLGGKGVPLGAAFVSEPIESPDGPFIIVDGKDFSRRQRVDLVDLVGAMLDEAGLTDAVVGVLRPHGPLEWSTLNSTPNCVQLRVFPERPHRGTSFDPFPPSWSRMAERWLGGQGASERDTVWASLANAATFTTAIADLDRIVDAVDRSGDKLLVAVGDLPHFGRGVHWTMDRSICFGIGGEELHPDGVRGVVDELEELARSLAPMGGAALSIDPSWRGFNSGRYVHPQHPFPYDDQLAAQRCDRAVIDGLHWQVLGPGHIEQLGGAPPAGAVDLGHGFWELTVGEPEDWWPQPGSDPPPPVPDNVGVRTDARNALAPLLIPYE